MFNIFNSSIEKQDSHNEAVEDLAEDLHKAGMDVKADHTDEFEDPDLINGRRPDVTAEGPFGRKIVKEVEHRENRGNKGSRRQRSAFQEAEDENPFSIDFDTDWI